MPLRALLLAALAAAPAAAGPIELPEAPRARPGANVVAARVPAALSGPAGAALLWHAAGMPALDRGRWASLQRHDAAALAASAALVERLQDPQYRAKLESTFGRLQRGAGADMVAGLESVAVARLSAAGLEAKRRALGETEAVLAQGKDLRLAAGPRGLASAWTGSSLDGYAQGLIELRAEKDPAAALAALAARFDGARRPAGAAAVAGQELVHASPLAPAAPFERASAAHDAPPAPTAPAAPHKELKLRELVALGINSIIGAGIFVKSAALMAVAGGASLFAFPVTALALIPVGLCFAEAATYFGGKDGGSYHYIRGAFPREGKGAVAGEWLSFSVTWLTWVSAMLSWAGVTGIIAANLSRFGALHFLASPLAGKLLAAGVIGLITTINYRGVKEGAKVSNFFAVAKVVPLVLFGAIGLLFLHPASYPALGPTTVQAMGNACFLTVFALMGFENIPVAGADVHEPEKNIPRAIVIAMIGCSALYALIHAVALGVVPHLATAATPIVDGGFALAGALGAAIMSLTVVFSTAGDSAAAALLGARFVKALADDKHLPFSERLSAIHDRYKTPALSVALTGTLAILATLFLPVSKLMDVASIGVLSQYLAACVALPFLRRRRAAPEGAYRVPGGALLPAVGAAVAGYLIYKGGAAQVLTAVLFLAIGLGLKASRRLFAPRSA